MAETDIEIIMDGSPEMGEAPAMMETEEMAMAGRNGDTVVGHLTEGELVVPTEVFEGNPDLVDILFSRMREAGIEDPERYIVGSELNSINPETGMPEFFIGSIGKAVGGAFGAVGSALKAAAPYALPVALAMTPLGPVYGAAAGAGITSLVQGGNFNDALKASLMAGGTGAFSAGIASKFAGGTFGQGVSGALANPAQRLTQTLSPSAGGIFSSFTPTPTPLGMGPATSALQMPPNALAQIPASAPTAAVAPRAYVAPLPGSEGTLSAGPVVLPNAQLRVAAQPSGFMDTVSGYMDKASGYMDKASNYLSPTRESIMPTTGEITARAEEYVKQGYSMPKALDIARQDLAPGLIQKYGPLAALGTAGLYAGGFFEQPEVDQPIPAPTGADLISQDPGRYRIASGSLAPTRAAGQYYVPTKYYEDGGEVFPRRNGGIMPNEGISDEDSVRAMLMPGEFVMTTDAVRGAGNGNLNRGISNMYDMMRNLENRNDRMS